MGGTDECSDEFAERVLEMAKSIGLNATIVS